LRPPFRSAPDLLDLVDGELLRADREQHRLSGHVDAGNHAGDLGRDRNRPAGRILGGDRERVRPIGPAGAVVAAAVPDEFLRADTDREGAGVGGPVALRTVMVAAADAVVWKLEVARPSAGRRN
jgi:hypothetical protein